MGCVIAAGREVGALQSPKQNPIVIACKHCVEQGAPVLLAACTATDGHYQLMCGGDHESSDDAVTVHYSVLSNEDPTLLQFLSFASARDFLAERKDVASTWKITELNIDDMTLIV
jgi:hypothetical protein